MWRRALRTNSYRSCLSLKILVHGFAAAGPVIVVVDHEYPVLGQMWLDPLQARHDRFEPVAIDVRQRHRAVDAEGLLEETFDQMDIVRLRQARRDGEKLSDTLSNRLSS